MSDELSQDLTSLIEKKRIVISPIGGTGTVRRSSLVPLSSITGLRLFCQSPFDCDGFSAGSAMSC